MAEIRPFRALRPIPELICKIAELPYDVMNQKEARDMLRQNPLSFLQEMCIRDRPMRMGRPFWNT